MSYPPRCKLGMNDTTYLKCLSDSKNSLSATLKSLCIESKHLLIELTGGWISLDVFFAEQKHSQAAEMMED